MMFLISSVTHFELNYLMKGAIGIKLLLLFGLQIIILIMLFNVKKINIKS